VIHGDAAHGGFAELLGDFEHEAVALVLGFERVQDFRQMAVELHVDDGADDLGDAARRGGGDGVGHGMIPSCGQSARAPEGS
jgi:hypothetical protein